MCAKFWGRRDAEELIIVEHGLDIETGAAAEDGLSATRDDIVIGDSEVSLEAEDIVLDARVDDVDEMVGDWLSVDDIVVEVLAGAN